MAVDKTFMQRCLMKDFWLNLYWRDNVHADVIVLWLMCHVGSLCVNKILTYYLISSFSLQFGILSHIKKKTSKHHSGAVTWVPWRLKSSETGLFVQYSHWVKLNTNALHFLPFSRGIHRCPTDYSHKEPVMWQALPCESLICVDHAVCYMVVAEALAQIGTRLSATTIPISRNEKMHPIN